MYFFSYSQNTYVRFPFVRSCQQYLFSENHLLYCVQGDTLAVVSMSQRATARIVAASLNLLSRRAFRLFRERRKDGKND